MKTFVLVGDEQIPVSPREAANAVADRGFKLTAASYGVAEQTLRRFLAANGYEVQRQTSYVVAQKEVTTSDNEAQPATSAGQL